MESNNTLDNLVENFSTEEITPNEELSLNEKIQISLYDHIQKELRKGKKMRTIKREIFRKTGIQI
jgi:uncharacterized protein YheU (UPF0270 family)